MASSSSSFLAPPSIISSLTPPPPSSLMYAGGGGRINFPRSLSSSKSIMLRSNSIVKRRAIAIETNNYNNSEDERMQISAPWLMLPPVGGVYSRFYSLTEKKVVELEGFGGCDSSSSTEVEVIGSSNGFLVLNDDSTGIMFLYNPISARRIHLPNTISLLRKEIIDMYPGGVKKVIISDDESSSAMMIFGPENRLAFCTPGGSTTAGWTLLGGGYTDVVYSKRRKAFMCSTIESKVEGWDLLAGGDQLKHWLPEELIWESHKHVQHWWNDFEDAEPYVVFAEHSDQLYLVYRHIVERPTYVENIKTYGFPLRDWDDCFPTKTISFDVYKVTPVDNTNTTLQLDYMEGSLDNLVMFIGVNHSFALPADDYPELKPNSIYFTDHPDWNDIPEPGGICDTGIYYFNDRTFFPLEDYYPTTDLNPPKQNHDDKVQVNHLWFTPSPH